MEAGHPQTGTAQPKMGNASINRGGVGVPVRGVRGVVSQALIPEPGSSIRALSTARARACR
eukprot:244668-Rhodomonas_salina.2